MRRIHPFCRTGLVLVGLLTLVGCANRQRDRIAALNLPKTGLSHGFYADTVEATAIPTQGWTRDHLRQSTKHTHEVWISPSGTTCYGVMHFSLPLPVGPDMVLWGFLREMQRKQGEAKLLEQEKDPQLPGIRFVAEGGPYRIRVNLLIHGWEAWAIYAGTLRDKPVNENELDLAERAREYTETGTPASARIQHENERPRAGVRCNNGFAVRLDGQ